MQQDKYHLEFDSTQREAITRCIDISDRNRIVPITGQAGTGKTSIMRHVYYALIDAGYTVVLCAPTGKAAKRIQEATGIMAMTIHRLLEYPHPGERDPKTGAALRTTDPKRDKFHPLDYDVVLADEYAMVNWEVHRNLVDALPRSGCLRAFGDVNQLPPIEKNKQLQSDPSPFQELIAKFEGVQLTTIHRQAEGSSIVANGARILRGMSPLRTDFFTMKITDQPVNALRDYVLEMRKDHGIDFSGLDCQIISPTKKRWTGTAKLNALLQSLFRPETDGWLDLPRHSWAEDKYTAVHISDKVIWTENDYNVEVFNGETGIVTAVNLDEGEVTIDFGDRVVVVPPIVLYEGPHGTRSYDPRKSIDLAYAITTHKAQGSEYTRVVYVLNRSAMFVQNRSNFYTAITRAREYVHLITDQASLSNSLWKKGK